MSILFKLSFVIQFLALVVAIVGQFGAIDPNLEQPVAMTLLFNSPILLILSILTLKDKWQKSMAVIGILLALAGGGFMAYSMLA